MKATLVGLEGLEHLTRTPDAVSVLARMAVCAMVLTGAAMFLPWQQTSTGSGRVVAWSPAERQQNGDPDDGAPAARHLMISITSAYPTSVR